MRRLYWIEAVILPIFGKPDVGRPLLGPAKIFEFHDSLWKQEVGAAMGSRPIPAHANIFMAKIDALVKTISRKYSMNNCEALTLFQKLVFWRKLIV